MRADRPGHGGARLRRRHRRRAQADGPPVYAIDVAANRRAAKGAGGGKGPAQPECRYRLNETIKDTEEGRMRITRREFGGLAAGALSPRPHDQPSRSRARSRSAPSTPIPAAMALYGDEVARGYELAAEWVNAARRRARPAGPDRARQCDVGAGGHRRGRAARRARQGRRAGRHLCQRHLQRRERERAQLPQALLGDERTRSRPDRSRPAELRPLRAEQRRLRAPLGRRRDPACRAAARQAAAATSRSVIEHEDFVLRHLDREGAGKRSSRRPASRSPSARTALRAIDVTELDPARPQRGAGHLDERPAMSSTPIFCCARRATRASGRRR